MQEKAKTTETTRAIILLNPPYKAGNREFREEIENCCLENNFTIARFIETRGSNDYRALKRLIKATNTWKKKARTVIIDQAMVNTQENSLICAILGALSAAGCIDIYIYERLYSADQHYRGIKLYSPAINNHQILYMATRHFGEMLTFVNQLKQE